MVYDAQHALEHPEVAGWALGSLDPHDVAAFGQHLQTCEKCRGEVAEFSPVAESLALAAPAVEPPADLDLRVVAAVQYAALAESAATPSVPEAPATATHGSHRYLSQKTLWARFPARADAGAAARRGRPGPTGCPGYRDCPWCRNRSGAAEVGIDLGWISSGLRPAVHGRDRGQGRRGGCASGPRGALGPPGSGGAREGRVSPRPWRGSPDRLSA